MNRLKNKVAVVTGAGSGIGRAIAMAFAAEGASVGIVDLNAKSVDDVCREIEEMGGNSIPFVNDVSDREQIHGLVNDLADRTGRIDVLVNNAMWFRYEPISEVTEETADRMIGVGLKASVWGIQAVVPHMVQSGGGAIVNIASIAAEVGIANASIYCTVKGGIAALTRQAATELGAKGVRVNSIAPGPIPTPGATSVVDEAGWKNREQQTPIRRLGTVEEIGKIAVFLACSESSILNGEMIRADGGLTNSMI